AADLKDGDRAIVQVEGREIAVFRHEGEFYGVLNFCVHQAGPLCEGRLTGEMVIGEDGWEWYFENHGRNIVCPWHGWVFDITTGKSVDDDRYAVPTYEVAVEDGEVYVLT
ncbi:MAG: Rieske (2Fe-2S) protein, partial [Halobacteriales archaeon]|nr:Rieske (2Fe-2S) protein [Halobacteriales archaeon]